MPITVKNDAANRPLETITPSGTITVIGNTNTPNFVSGLAYVNGTLYAADQNDNLYKLDTTTGASTLIGSLGISTFRFNLAYDSANSTLYLNTGTDGLSADNSLYTVNISTGAATLVGSNGATNGFGIDGLAFQPAAVPEPSALVLLAVSLLCGTTVLRRRKNMRYAA